MAKTTEEIIINPKSIALDIWIHQSDIFRYYVRVLMIGTWIIIILYIHKKNCCTIDPFLAVWNLK